MPDLRRLLKTPAREGALVWVAVFAVLAVAELTIRRIPSWGGSIVGALAVGLFLVAPTEIGRAMGRPDEDYGLNLQRWKQDTLFALVVMAVVFPLFTGGFLAFLKVADRLPYHEYLTPYGASRSFHWRPPADLLNKVAGNIAVALSEEFFYRGYLARRFSDQWPARTFLWGAPFGRAVWLQTALFALGHLLEPSLFRLGTFFPGLLFSWMAARSGRILPSTIVHASSNLLIATLEASSFGP